MSSVIESLKRQESKARSDYAGLAQRIANGEKVDEAKAPAILAASGRTAENLEAEVNRLRRVAELRATVQQIEAELKTKDAERIAHGEAMLELRRRYDALGLVLEEGAAQVAGFTAACTVAGRRLSEVKQELSTIERLEQ